MTLGFTLLGTVPTFGENLRRIRENRKPKKMTLKELADALGIAEPSNLSTLENGDRLPEPETIVRYAEALGCSPADLLEGVVTDYDRLRGGKPLGPEQLDEAPSIPGARELLREWARLTGAQRDALLQMMKVLPRESGAGAAAPTPPQKKSDARTARRAR